MSERIRQLEKLFGKDRRLFFDIDGTIADSASLVIAETWNEFGIKINACNLAGSDYISGKICELLPERNFREVQKWEWGLWTDPDVLLRAEPIPGARFLTWQLSEKDYDVAVVTSRNSGLVDSTFAWLAKHFPWISPDKIYIRRDGDPRQGYEFKVDMVKDGVLFEDSLFHAEIVAAENPGSLVILNPYRGEIGASRYPNIIEVPSAQGQRNMWYFIQAIPNLVAQY